MKKHVKKLTLSRETLHRLTSSSLAAVAGGTDGEMGVVAQPLSIPVCTNAISDCLTCTQVQGSCPPSMQTYCTCA
jgi:hypothetical protein